MLSWLELTAILNRPIAFHRTFAEIGGGAIPGLFLSQSFYWTQRTRDKDGWFYKTQEEWFVETALTRSEQERARRELKERGLLEEQKKGLPCKTYYRINKQVLLLTLSGFISKPDDCQVAESSILDEVISPDSNSRSRKQACKSQQACLRISASNLYTEITPEINTETTSSPLTPQGETEGGALELNSEEETPTTDIPSLANQNQVDRETSNPILESKDSASRRENDSQPQCDNSTLRPRLQEVAESQKAKLESRYLYPDLQKWLSNKDFCDWYAKYHLANTVHWKQANRRPTKHDANNSLISASKEDCAKVANYWNAYQDWLQEQPQQSPTPCYVAATEPPSRAVPIAESDPVARRMMEETRANLKKKVAEQHAIQAAKRYPR